MNLPEVYKAKSISNLIHLLRIGRNSGSSSVDDFKELILKKFDELPNSDGWKKIVLMDGGNGFIGENIAEMRFLLIERNKNDTKRES